MPCSQSLFTWGLGGGSNSPHRTSEMAGDLFPYLPCLPTHFDSWQVHTPYRFANIGNKKGYNMGTRGNILIQLA